MSNSKKKLSIGDEKNTGKKREKTHGLLKGFDY
jgi:hypothetical protein